MFLFKVKDTMRLLGVINSSPVLASRLGIGGATAAWVIKEFTVQVCAVSKIALHRRENMAMFLETHGNCYCIYVASIVVQLYVLYL